MATHKSAEKRHRQSEKRRARNKGLKTQLRHIVRSVRASIETKDPKDAAATLATASKALSKAASKGVIHRNAASRKIARLSRAVQGLPS